MSNEPDGPDVLLLKFIGAVIAGGVFIIMFAKVMDSAW